MIVVGIGCRRGVTVSQVDLAVREAAATSGLPLDRIEALATPAFKSGETGISEAASLLALPLHLISRAQLEAAQPACVSSSAVVRDAVGVGAVAEAAALAAAGEEATLLLPRTTHGSVTCAIATGGSA